MCRPGFGFQKQTDCVYHNYLIHSLYLLNIEPVQNQLIFSQSIEILDGSLTRESYISIYSTYLCCTTLQMKKNVQTN